MFTCDREDEIINSPHITWRCWRCCMDMRDLLCDALSYDIGRYILRMIIRSTPMFPFIGFSLDRHIKLVHEMSDFKRKLREDIEERADGKKDNKALRRI